MNAPSASSRRVIASPARSPEHAPPGVVLAHATSRTTSEAIATTSTQEAANLLWANLLLVMTAASALFYATMAVLVLR